jgi:hypothetical protein
MSKYLFAEYVVSISCDYCHRKRIQRIGIADYCESHLLMELLELQDVTEMKLVKVAIGRE